MYQLIRRGWTPPKQMPPAGFESLVDSVIDIETYHPTLVLTAKQVQILEELASGSTYLSLAEEAGIGRESVKTQAKLIRDKLGARNTTHAVAIAMRQRIIT